MAITPKALLEGFRHLTNNPKLTMGLAALSLPIYLIYAATQFVDQPGGRLIIVGAGVVSFIFAGWLVRQFNTNS